ncbi:hypothetical protein ACH5RR_037186 [Cinchona calisaya]|uniref:malate dehydrogenase n=1 Tax=Cinchona calisaya TaxID=153742 RepID=A0ABD2Y5C9_9GENT
MESQIEKIKIDVGGKEKEDFQSNVFEAIQVFDKMHKSDCVICEDGNEEEKEMCEGDDEIMDWTIKMVMGSLTVMCLRVQKMIIWVLWGISEKFQVQVAGFAGEWQLGQALEGADVVIIPAGVPRKPGMTVMISSTSMLGLLNLSALPS